MEAVLKECEKVWCQGDPVNQGEIVENSLLVKKLCEKYEQDKAKTYFDSIKKIFDSVVLVLESVFYNQGLSDAQSQSWNTDIVLHPLLEWILICSRIGPLGRSLACHQHFKLLCDMTVSCWKEKPICAFGAVRIVVNVLLQAPDMSPSVVRAGCETLNCLFAESGKFKQMEVQFKAMLFRAVAVMIAKHEVAFEIATNGNLYGEIGKIFGEMVSDNEEKSDKDLLLEAMKVLFAISQHWTEQTGETDSIDELEKRYNQFFEVMEHVHFVIAQRSEETQLLETAVNVMMMGPKGAGSLILGRMMTRSQMIQKQRENLKKPVEITERHWDPTEPGKEVITKVRSGTEASDMSDSAADSEQIHVVDEVDLEVSEIENKRLDVLIKFLELRLDTAPARLAYAVCPVANVIRIIATDVPSARKYLRDKIIPRRTDFSQRPEMGESLSAKLIKLLDSPNMEICQSIAELLYVICNKNVSRLVRRTGFGNAAGFLANRGIMNIQDLGGKVGRTDSDSETSESESETINPVTGTYWEPEEPNTMTDEEKEAAAVELMGMLKRLDELGVIKPQFR